MQLPSRPNTSDALALVGRVLLALLFVLTGVSKIIAFPMIVDRIVAGGLPFAPAGAAAAATLEIVCGMSLIFGFRIRVSAIALAVFSVVATYLFHAFWSLPPEVSVERRMIEMHIFFKDIAVAGGLLVLAAHGAGAWSLDSRWRLPTK